MRILPSKFRTRIAASRDLFALVGIAIGTVVLWRLPFGTFLLWPFTLLSTWYHEMGHGLTAMILGGDFVKLQIFPDGSGFAVYQGELFWGRIGRAMVAAGGPVAPSIVGGFLIISSRSAKTTRSCLVGLGLVAILSVCIWIKGPTGLSVLLVLSGLILYVAWRGSEFVQRFTLQLLGVQACISLYQNLGYLFTAEVEVDGKVQTSDTGTMAQALFLPHWIWGMVLTGFSLFVLYHSLRIAYGSKEQHE